MIKKLNFPSLAHKMNFKFLLQVPDSFMCINVNNNNNNIFVMLNNALFYCFTVLYRNCDIELFSILMLHYNSLFC